MSTCFRIHYVPPHLASIMENYDTPFFTLELQCDLNDLDSDDDHGGGAYRRKASTADLLPAAILWPN